MRIIITEKEIIKLILKYMAEKCPELKVIDHHKENYDNLGNYEVLLEEKTDK